MKIIKKILYVVLILLSLLSLFIIICAFRPELAEKVSGVLYPEKAVSIPMETEPDVLSTEEETGLLLTEGVTDTLPAEEEKGDLSTEEKAGGTGVLSSDSVEQPGQYIPPKEDNVKAPENVSGRGGYLPVQENSEKIEDSIARSIPEQVGYGETGGGLVFDATYYPYYAMLNETGQELYRQIYANGEALNGTFAPVQRVTAGELRNIFSAVYNDHPELFWLDTAYRGKFTKDGRCAEITLQFNKTADNLSASRESFASATAEVMAAAQGLDNDYEKEKAVHDALLAGISYHLDAPMNQSAYSALVNGQTVCAGYARAFQYVMQQLGVPCYYCTGYAGQNHAWNIIKLEDEYYNADLTWDDTEPNTLDYFNKTDADFSNTHIRQELSVYLPPCSGQKYKTQTETENNGVFKPEDEDVITGMEDYYADCYNRILEAAADGRSTVQFENTLRDSELWSACYDAYQSGAYEEAYMKQVLETVGAASCRIDVQANELSDGSFLLSHEIIFEWQ